MTRVYPGMKVVARSASDKTNDWPYWMLWNGTVNVTAECLDFMGVPREPGQVLLHRADAELHAAEWSKLHGLDR